MLCLLGMVRLSGAIRHRCLDNPYRGCSGSSGIIAKGSVNIKYGFLHLLMPQNQLLCSVNM